MDEKGTREAAMAWAASGRGEARGTPREERAELRRTSMAVTREVFHVARGWLKALA